jgi:photosystem II stability/assembly factor-like uncharacterized protein
MKQLNRLKELNKPKELLSTLLFYLSILFFIIGFNFSDTPLNGGWTQQFMPNLGGQSISSITFLDSLTGFAVTQSASISDTAFVLKTTNGGDNWIIKYRAVDDYSRIMFANQDTGFVSGGDLIKTTNAGENWFSINRPNQTNIEDMYVLNNDTLWLVDNNSLTGGVFRTTNGGADWQQQLALGSQNPNHIYMYNGRHRFICEDNVYLRRTTNSGLNWDTVSGAGGFLDMYFVDSLTGWKTSMQKTTDGGLNWVNQTLPSGGNIIASAIRSFTNVNKDTIWGVGGWLQYPNFQNRGMIYKTTNSGTNWGFQLADTNINIAVYSYADFVNKLNGWAWTNGSRGVHTVIGGSETTYTSIKQVSSKTPDGFKLEQNYPNPFNPSTIIRFQILSLADIRLIVYDVTGKEIIKLTDKEYKPGAYEVSFGGTNYSTGIYFYSFIVDGKLIDTKKMILVK